jgi:hypothetical protein
MTANGNPGETDSARRRLAQSVGRAISRLQDASYEFDNVAAEILASIRIARARRASSARILRLRTRRSCSVRSSVVNVSAIWRQQVRVLLQSVQATR